MKDKLVEPAFPYNAHLGGLKVLSGSQIITGMIGQIKQGIIVRPYTSGRRNSSNSEAVEKALSRVSKDLNQSQIFPLLAVST